jgi:hypothetical protein
LQAPIGGAVFDQGCLASKRFESALTDAFQAQGEFAETGVKVEGHERRDGATAWCGRGRQGAEARVQATHKRFGRQDPNATCNQTSYRNNVLFFLSQAEVSVQGRSASSPTTSLTIRSESSQRAVPSLGSDACEVSLPGVAAREGAEGAERVRIDRRGDEGLR